tara:strand:+ start:319 stop:708 length:390 start_codon:yes stop_codon:yes gene_type:complete
MNNSKIFRIPFYLLIGLGIITNLNSSKADIRSKYNSQSKCEFNTASHHSTIDAARDSHHYCVVDNVVYKVMRTGQGRILGPEEYCLIDRQKTYDLSLTRLCEINSDGDLIKYESYNGGTVERVWWGQKR